MGNYLCSGDSGWLSLGKGFEEEQEEEGQRSRNFHSFFSAGLFKATGCVPVPLHPESCLALAWVTEGTWWVRIEARWQRSVGKAAAFPFLRSLPFL